MTETTREIFKKYQVRKNKKQKRAFIEYVNHLASKWGYSARVEKGMFGARNILIGDISKAKVIYTAHYDTCPVLPFPNFITPKCIALYLLYQVGIIFGIFAAVAICIGILAFLAEALNLGTDFTFWITELAYLGLLFLLLAGPKNKHTANDNTSGVTLLIDIMRDLPEEERDAVAFVFFDLEEMGLFGSMSFARKHKREIKDKLLLNFDCVSDGENMLFALRKKAKKYQTAIETAFQAKGCFKVDVAHKGVFYPSDQMQFPCGVGVAALRSTKGGLLYMNRIHTRRDVIYCEENIDFLKIGALELPKLI